MGVSAAVPAGDRGPGTSACQWGPRDGTGLSVMAAETRPHCACGVSAAAVAPASFLNPHPRPEPDPVLTPSAPPRRGSIWAGLRGAALGRVWAGVETPPGDRTVIGQRPHAHPGLVPPAPGS